MVLLFDGAAANAYVYQSLGAVSAADIAAGTLRITADFAEKSDDSSVNGTFDVYVGSFTGAHGTDISGGGLTSLFSRTMTAANQGLSAASGDQSRATDVLVGEVDISSITAGEELWLRIGRPGSGSGDFLVDNVVVTVVSI